MSRPLLLRILFCIFLCSLFLYSYIDAQNSLTDLRIRLPLIAKEVRMIREENRRLQYEIDQFEKPQHLMELASYGEFSHLKHPLLREVMTCREGIALEPHTEKQIPTAVAPSKSTLAFATVQ